jgi:cytidyltransferase-like protein
LGKPRKLGVVAGSFNPPTIAHEELVYAAGSHVDEVLCVVPSIFPHKEFVGATLEQRLEMLAAAELSGPASIAVSEKGLFIDIARIRSSILSVGETPRNASSLGITAGPEWWRKCSRSLNYWWPRVAASSGQRLNSTIAFMRSV